MAVLYFDPDGGNDANDGTTFALRKKSWAGISPGAGDELRIMAARDPHSLGLADWTNNSNLLVLAAAKNTTIDNANAVWTGVTNVTVSQLTSAGITRVWKEGTGSGRAVVAATFTTGVIAYKALGATLDLSAYKAISMKIGHSIVIAQGVLRLDLCSDTAGAVPVASLIIPTGGAVASAGYSAYMEQASALPSNVNSIALYAVTDPGTVTIEWDNIVACFEKGHANHLCHESMITKQTTDEPEMWPIRCIDGANITLGPPASTGAGNARNYAGATENVTTYCQQTQTVTAVGSLSGASAWAVTGGWDRVGMTTQSGETFLSGRLNVATAFTRTIAADYTISKVSFTGFTSGLALSASGGSINIQSKHASGNVILGSATVFGEVSFDYAVMNDAFGVVGNVNPYNQKWKIKLKLWGECNQSDRGFWTSATVIPWSVMKFTDLSIDRVRNNLVGFGGGSGIAGCAKLRDAVFSGNAADLPSFIYANQMFLDNCTFTTTYAPNDIGDGSLTFTRRNGSTQREGFISYFYALVSQTAMVPATGDTIAWAFQATSAFSPITSTYWPHATVAQIAAKAGKTYTVNFEMARSQSTIQGRVAITGPDGALADFANATAGINVWESRTLLFTAPADGVYDLDLGAMGNLSPGRLVYLANITIAES